MKLGVKTCGAMSEMDVRKAELSGVQAVGVVCRSNREPYVRSRNSHTVDVDKAARIVEATRNAGMTAVLLPRTADFNEITYMASVTKADRLQIGQSDDPALARQLHAFYTGRPGPEIAQVVKVGHDTDSSAVYPFLGTVDYILLDSAGPRPGGNGTTHDWQRSRRLAEESQAAGTPVILAGGLTAENVAQAVDVVRPDGVDVETRGIRKFDVYNQKMIQNLVAAAHLSGQGGAE